MKSLFAIVCYCIVFIYSLEAVKQAKRRDNRYFGGFFRQGLHPPANHRLSPECPFPYEEVGGLCLHAKCDEENPRDWEAARTACLSSGGDLAVLNDGCKFADALHYVRNVDDNKRCNYWIGGTDAFSLDSTRKDESAEGRWTWLDGTYMRLGAPFWGSSEGGTKLSPEGGHNNKDYAYLSEQNFFLIKDAVADGVERGTPLCQFIPKDSNTLGPFSPSYYSAHLFPFPFHFYQRMYSDFPQPPSPTENSKVHPVTHRHRTTVPSRSSVYQNVEGHGMMKVQFQNEHKRVNNHEGHETQKEPILTRKIVDVANHVQEEGKRKGTELEEGIREAGSDLKPRTRGQQKQTTEPESTQEETQKQTKTKSRRNMDDSGPTQEESSLGESKYPLLEHQETINQDLAYGKPFKNTRLQSLSPSELRERARITNEKKILYKTIFPDVVRKVAKAIHEIKSIY